MPLWFKNWQEFAPPLPTPHPPLEFVFEQRRLFATGIACNR